MSEEKPDRHAARFVHPTEGGPHRTTNGAPPWRKQRPELAARARSADQFQDTQKRVKRALDKSYQGTLLTDKELQVIAQTVLLDLLSSLDPLARAIAARELLELPRYGLAQAKDRALRAATKRDERNRPQTEHQLMANDVMARFNEEFGR